MILASHAGVREILGGVNLFKTSILRKRILRGNLFIVPESFEAMVKVFVIPTLQPGIGGLPTRWATITGAQRNN